MSPSKLVFIDETWTKTNMTRLYGRAPCGKRLVDAVPHGHWKTSTFIAALRCDGLTATGVFDGPINGELFLAYVEQVLVPTLRPGDVVIMDNLRSPACDRPLQPCWCVSPRPCRSRRSCAAARLSFSDLTHKEAFDLVEPIRRADVIMVMQDNAGSVIKGQGLIHAIHTEG